MSVWYDKEKDVLCLVDKQVLVWFSDNMFYKTYCCRGNKERRIKNKTELHERLWETGLVYIGEFD